MSNKENATNGKTTRGGGGGGDGGREGATGQTALLGTVPPAAGAQALKSDRRSDRGSLSLRLREVGQQRPPLVT